MRQWLLCLCMLFLCVGCAVQPTDTSPVSSAEECDAAALPEGQVRLRVLSVGKADCLLLTAGDFHMLIDTGENDTDRAVAAQLTKWGVRHLDILLLTHNDKDHIGGAPFLLGQFSVGRLIQADYDEDSAAYARYTAAATRAGHTPERLQEPLTLTRGGATIRLLPAVRTDYGDDNDFSILTEVIVGDRALLLTADAEKARLQEFLDTAAKRRYDVIKLPHHGGWNGASKAFLTDFVGGETIVSTSAEVGSAKKLRNWLENNGIPCRYTYDGTVTVLTDGAALSVTQEQE